VNILKHIKIGAITLLLFGLVIGLTGIVCADPGVPAVPESQAISTSTSAITDGLVMETDALTWQLLDQQELLGTAPNAYGGPEFKPSQYTTSYDANIVAQAGTTTMVKTMIVDTRNKVVSQSNVNANTGLTFIATADGGNIVGSENLLLDGVGMPTYATDRILCPFMAGTDTWIPACCNIVQSGSKYDLAVGSITTQANDVFVSSDASNPVVLNYNINVKPYGTTQGQIPAIGSAMAYIKVHVQEGGSSQNGFLHQFAPFGDGMLMPVKSEDITYSETASAQGTITAFNKAMGYSSQVISPVPMSRPT
jgi:hypothetical protein